MLSIGEYLSWPVAIVLLAGAELTHLETKQRALVYVISGAALIIIHTTSFIKDPSRNLADRTQRILALNVAAGSVIWGIVLISLFTSPPRVTS